MGIAERREREKEELRQKILDAARDLFAREGYDNVSMRKIASEIEYSPTTIYLYFKDKSELLNEICEKTFEELIAEMAEIVREGKSPLSCLKQSMKKYVEFGLKHPNQYMLTFTAPMPPEMVEEYSYQGSNGEKAFAHMAELVCESMEAGDLKNNDVMKTAQVIWALGHGLVSLLSAHESFPWVETDELIDGSIDMLMNGLET